MFCQRLRRIADLTPSRKECYDSKSALPKILRIVSRTAAERVGSLIWQGDTLVDWVAGGVRYGLDGEITPRAVNYAYHFDAACGSPFGKYSVIYERRGTKGLILDGGQNLREINRSFYYANVYEFPVCIARLESGQEVLIHCPERYNRLEIDDIATGERLTECDGRKPADYFHSRLAVAPNGGHFLSAGWVWHPFDALGVYRLNDALRDPKTLDQFGQFPTLPTEISSGAFVDDQRLDVRFVSSWVVPGITICSFSTVFSRNQALLLPTDLRNGHLVISTSDENFLDEEDLASEMYFSQIPLRCGTSLSLRLSGSRDCQHPPKY